MDQELFQQLIQDGYQETNEEMKRRRLKDKRESSCKSSSVTY